MGKVGAGGKQAEGETEICGIVAKKPKGRCSKSFLGEVGLKGRIGGICNSQEGPGHLHGMMEGMENSCVTWYFKENMLAACAH